MANFKLRQTGEQIQKDLDKIENDALVKPDIAPSATSIVAIDSANAQTMLTVGDGLNVENGALKVTPGTSVTVSNVSESTEDGGNNVVTFSDGKTLTVKNGKTGATGAAGAAGADGTSVTVSSVSESTADGGENIVTFSDGKTLTVKNGSKGSQGEAGAAGPAGPKGDPTDVQQTTGQSTTAVMSQKATTIEINALKDDLAKLDNELYLYTEEAIPVYKIDSPYSISTDGLKVSKQNYNIEKRKVTEGDLLYLHLSKDDADGAVYQFMKSESVSYSSKQNIVGATVTEAFDGYVIVPSEATYLMVVTSIGNTTNIIKKVSKTLKIALKEDLIPINEDIKTLQNGTMPLYNKNIINFGDSIFGNARPPLDLSTKIAQLTGANLYNCAFGGCRMGKHTGHWDAFSMYRLADAIATNDYSLQDDALNYSDRTSYAEEPLSTLKNIDFSNCDIITIAYGTNDFTGNDLDNDSDKMDTRTLAGALRYSLDKLMTAYPKIRIIVLGIIYRTFNDGSTSDDKINSYGKTIAAYNAKLKEVTEEFHIEYVDNYNIGLNKYTRNSFYPTTDGTHPNDEGLEVYARYIARHI